MNDDEFKAKIPANLSDIRKQHRYTQKEVAEMADLDSNYYAKVERGTSTPSLKTLYKIAVVFKVSISDIVGY